jgi:hypothetical protein
LQIHAKRRKEKKMEEISQQKGKEQVGEKQQLIPPKKREKDQWVSKCTQTQSRNSKKGKGSSGRKQR